MVLVPVVNNNNDKNVIMYSTVRKMYKITFSSAFKD